MSQRLSSVAPRRPPESAADLEERRSADLARVGRFIARLQETGYFGKITVHLQNGKLVELRTEQVLKVEDL